MYFPLHFMKEIARTRLSCIFKLRYYVFISLVLLYILFLKSNIHYNPYQQSPFYQSNTFAKGALVNYLNGRKNYYYVLLWAARRSYPFQELTDNTSCFAAKNCSYQNCFVTNNRNYFGDYSKFDVILFAGTEISSTDLPIKRTPHQIYVYVNKESSQYFPVCLSIYNNFYNWTLTYKLDSTIRWGYIIITNFKGEIVGPKKDMHWIKHSEMKTVDNNLKKLFTTKSKAVAWMASHCQTLSQREVIASTLKQELRLYNLTLDIYGGCGHLQCDDEKKGNLCHDTIEKNYYFYLSFENSFSEDYVTEKILTPLQHNAIPIVFGGANYTRFLPDGSYLDVRKLGIQELAKQINRLIRNKEEYYEYFRWRYHYKYFDKNANPITNDFCEFCAALNNNNKDSVQIQPEFTEWWSGPNVCPKERLSIFPDPYNPGISKRREKEEDSRG